MEIIRHQVISHGGIRSLREFCIFCANRGRVKRLEPYLERSDAVASEKSYYFSDARDEKQFAGKGPSYPSRNCHRKRSRTGGWLWMRLLDTVRAPRQIEQISKLSNVQIEKYERPEYPMVKRSRNTRFGKSEVPGAPDRRCFLRNQARARRTEMHAVEYEDSFFSTGDHIAIGGPLVLLHVIPSRHHTWLSTMAKVPEIAIKAGTVVAVPLHVQHADSTDPMNSVTPKIETPTGWKVVAGHGDSRCPRSLHRSN